MEACSFLTRTNNFLAGKQEARPPYLILVIDRSTLHNIGHIPLFELVTGPILGTQIYLVQACLITPMNSTLLRFGHTPTRLAFSQLWFLHPRVDKWLELSSKIGYMEYFLVYRGRLVMHGSLAIPSQAIK